MSDMGSNDRCSGYVELIAAMKEANAELMIRVTERLAQHRQQDQQFMADVKMSVALTAQKADEIGKVLTPIPARISALETSVRQIADNDKTQFDLITQIREDHRDLEVKVAKIPNVRQSLAAVKTNGGFLTSANGKYAIWAGILIIVGLFGIAGVNMTGVIKP